MTEADVHFEFYRHIQNAIDENPRRGKITYGYAKPEHGEDISGRADIVVFNDDDDPIFVVEAKRPDGSSSRDIDPYSRDVIQQAFEYAGGLGAPYFCTFNGERLIIFNTYEEGVPLLQRSTKSYTISNLEEFAETLLNEINDIAQGESEWDSLDDAFIDRINSLHDYLSPRVQQSLTEHLKKDDDFRDSFMNWTGAQGIDYKDSDAEEKKDIREEFSDQSSYLYINKIIFYKILEQSPTYSDDVLSLEVRSSHLREDLEEAFSHLVEEVDFEAIYEHDKIYSEIPLDPVADKIQSFISELDDQDLSQFDSDVIGRIYEGVIPADRRRDMGEYYTPPAICDLITRLTINESDDTVFDPAVGSGGFMVSSYHRLRNMLPESRGSHNKILNQLYATEINRFPAHLTAINLAIQDLSSYTDEVNVEVSDFFDVKPGYLRISPEKATAEGSETSEGMTEEVGGFDAVVANPPYIRQENIDNKTKVRSHLSNDKVNSEYFSKRSDIYAYFLTHATEFLNQNGKLGFITSDRWLDTQYGEDVQKFILENYKIDAIIKFGRQVFDDALVGSSVLILEREKDRDQRHQNVAKFLRLREEMSVSDIASIVEEDHEPDKMISTDSYRLVTQNQSTLYQENKWNLFFMAPPMYFEMRGRDNVVAVEDIAEVTRGITSGANKFFYGRKEEFEDLGIEQHTNNLLKATGQINKIRFDEDDAREWGVLDIHDLVNKALEEADGEFGTEPEQQVKNWLIEAGYDSLVEYIEWGESKGYDDRRSFEDKDIWFDLGDVPIAPILNTRFTWREHRMVWNEAEAIADQQFYMIKPEPQIDSLLLCGILNSRVTALTNELLGRRAGGEGMTRLQKTIYETEMLPIPDPRKIKDDMAERIKNATVELMKKEDEIGEDAPIESKMKEKDELDTAVLETMGLENRLDELKQAVESLVRARDNESGRSTEVLVERLQKAEERGEAIDLPGVESARESTTLGDF